jgi:hypothetical protein
MAADFRALRIEAAANGHVERLTAAAAAAAAQVGEVQSLKFGKVEVGSVEVGRSGEVK